MIKITTVRIAFSLLLITLITHCLSAQSCLIEIHREDNIKNKLLGSTYSSNSFAITNLSADNQNISSVRIDLSTALVQGMVFDPAGKAGDLVAKDFTNDDPANQAGVQDASFANGSDEDGYLVMTVNYNNFEPQESSFFSVDVDPRSIKGLPAPGPNDTGSVSGMELIGATVTVMYSDGSSQMAKLAARKNTLAGAWAKLPISPQQAVTIGLNNDPSSPVTRFSSAQTISIAGTPNAKYELTILQGGQYQPANTNLPFAAYEANTIIAVNQFFGTLSNGNVAIEVDLFPENDNEGFFFIMATLVDQDGQPLKSSNPLIVKIDENVEDDDQDGDGITDDIDTCPDAPNPDQQIPIWYVDKDNDGYGVDDPATNLQDCIAPVGYVARAGDCDDQQVNINPEQLEIADNIDNNCDGQVDEGFPDTDNDGIIDELDNCPDQPNPDQILTTYYLDNDEDGFGNTDDFITSCTPLEGYVELAGDCNDNDETIFPQAPEKADNIDNNCDGQIDEGFPDTDNDGIIDALDNCPETPNPDQQFITFFADQDKDGFGDPNNTIQDCLKPLGFVENSDDCDDSDPNTFPFAEELPDGKDNNCDGQIDEGFSNDMDNDGISDELDNCPTVPNPDQIIPVWYADADNDGFGDPNEAVADCQQPTGFVANNQDCDDQNPQINPNATEIADNIDNNCDGQIDEGMTIDGDNDGISDELDNCPTVPNPDQIIPVWYADADNDGFGDPNEAVADCQQPTGFVDNNQDCDDQNPQINPNATEIADNIDNNCDGRIDEGVVNINPTITAIKLIEDDRVTEVKILNTTDTLTLDSFINDFLKFESAQTDSVSIEVDGEVLTVVAANELIRLSDIIFEDKSNYVIEFTPFSFNGQQQVIGLERTINLFIGPGAGAPNTPLSGGTNSQLPPFTFEADGQQWNLKVLKEGQLLIANTLGQLILQTKATAGMRYELSALQQQTIIVKWTHLSQQYQKTVRKVE
ncbi:MopE-related protein [Persicobacter psychrovividus]|uniref:Cartilage oligomeric matrix protein n=1 Tax=Persicobacter psychrovividus TaxID=387638 RepID=A0ABM7VJ81_9BACT|nr:hypothetical protein PEPS_33310 [Persicobacter psychrovividus]